MVAFDPANAIGQQLERRHINFILIDRVFLENDQWTLLNDLDQQAPDIPVVILGDSIGKKDRLQTRELSVTFLDREKVFRDPLWVSGQLHALI